MKIWVFSSGYVKAKSLSPTEGTVVGGWLPLQSVPLGQQFSEVMTVGMFTDYLEKQKGRCTYTLTYTRYIK